MFQTTIDTTSVIAISDTHGRHRELQIPGADIIIHAGDACTDGDLDQLADFFDWYAGLPVRYKIFVPANVIWLNNKVIQIAGIRIGALPPHFHWIDSFAHTGERVDILVTHGPPYGILDRNAGCKELRNYVMAAQPRFHFFGHIHEEAGKTHRVGGSSFINACVFKD